LGTLEKMYEEEGDPNHASFDISLLRLHPKDATHTKPIGIELHFEPRFVDGKSSNIEGYDLTSIPVYTPLSDLYYRLIQDSDYIMDHRRHTFNDIGRQFMEYMSWSTFPWEKYFKMKMKELKNNDCGSTTE